MPKQNQSNREGLDLLTIFQSNVPDWRQIVGHPVAVEKMQALCLNILGDPADHVEAVTWAVEKLKEMKEEEDRPAREHAAFQAYKKELTKARDASAQVAVELKQIRALVQEYHVKRAAIEERIHKEKATIDAFLDAWPRAEVGKRWKGHCVRDLHLMPTHEVAKDLGLPVSKDSKHEKPHDLVLLEGESYDDGPAKRGESRAETFNRIISEQRVELGGQFSAFGQTWMRTAAGPVQVG